MGNWASNLKHGIGKKTYANGDSYEGLWNHGKAEGPGRCGGGGGRGAGRLGSQLRASAGEGVLVGRQSKVEQQAGHGKMVLVWHGKAAARMLLGACAFCCGGAAHKQLACPDNATHCRYVWHNGNQYDGEWRAGKMHGQGTLKWVTGGTSACLGGSEDGCNAASLPSASNGAQCAPPSMLPWPRWLPLPAGERYDGEWLEGQESGVGVFTWQDGSTYEGFWLGGRKEGVGVFRPAPHTQGMPGSDPSVRPPPGRQPAGVADGTSPPHSPVAQAAATDLPLDSPAAAGRAVRQLASLQQGEHMSRLLLWDQLLWLLP